MIPSRLSVDDLAKLIAEADRKHGGCTVLLHGMSTTSLDVFGVVTYGMKECERVFHSVDELHAIMGRLVK